MKTHLEKLVASTPEKRCHAHRLGYALNNWHKFTAFLDCAEMPLNNSAMEQAVRPFTIGIKNLLFAGSARGAYASASIYSIIETAKANRLEPKAYLKAVFEQYPLATDDNQRRQLLPWNFKFKE